MDLCQAPGERRRDRTTNIGIVNVVSDETHQLAVAEDRLPEMHVGRMGGYVPRIRVTHVVDVPFLVLELSNDGPVVETGEPGGSEGLGRGDGQTFRRHHLAREVLRLF